MGEQIIELQIWGEKSSLRGVIDAGVEDGEYMEDGWVPARQVFLLVE